MNNPPKVTVNINERALKLLYKEKEFQSYADEAADLVVQQAKSTVHIISGNLHDHIEARENPQGGRDIGVWDVPYADAEEELHPYLRPALDAAKGKNYGTRQSG